MPPLDPSYCGFSNFLLELTFIGILKFCVVFCLLFSKKPLKPEVTVSSMIRPLLFLLVLLQALEPRLGPSGVVRRKSSLCSISFSCHLLAPHSPWLSTLAFDNTALIGLSQLPRTVSSGSHHSSLLYLLQMF